MGKVIGHPLNSADRLVPPALIGHEHDLSRFDCGDSALNTWLKTRALKNEGRHGRTYVLCVGREVIGYFCICAGSVERSGVPKKMHRNAPGSVPVSIIARLAVDRSYKGRKLGRDLLADAVRRICSASQVVGMAAVMAHAKSDEARAFYMRCAEFLEYPAESRTLFLPIETALAAL